MTTLHSKPRKITFAQFALLLRAVKEERSTAEILRMIEEWGDALDKCCEECPFKKQGGKVK